MITRDELMRLAEISRFEIPESDAGSILESLTQLTELAAAVESAPVEGCEPGNISGLCNVLRKDEVTSFDARETLLESCAAEDGGLLRIPKHRMQ